LPSNLVPWKSPQGGSFSARSDSGDTQKVRFDKSWRGRRGGREGDYLAIAEGVERSDEDEAVN